MYFRIRAGNQRPVVGNDFGDERDAEQGEEHPQAPIAATVDFEGVPAALVDRRQLNAAPHALQETGFGALRSSLPQH